MLLPSESSFKLWKQLQGKFRRREIAPERALEQMVEADPGNGWALHGLALYWLETGDHAKAEDYAWRAIHAHPFHAESYLVLAELLWDRDPALASGLEELGLRKLLCDPIALREYLEGQTSDEEGPDQPERVWDAEQIAQRADSLSRQRVHEPTAVTRRLRPFRLIHELQATREESLEPALVDRILENATQCGPLLLGLLRGWAWQVIRPCGDFVAAASLALLGEMGEPAWLSALLEFAVLEHARLSAVAGWAIGRVAQRRPAETLQQLRALAPEADANQMVYIAAHLTSLPPAEERAEFLLEQLRDFERYGKRERDTVFSALAIGYLAAAWPHGGQVLEELLLSCRARLKKKTIETCQELIARCETQPPSPPLFYEGTVYDICCPARASQTASSQAPAAKPGRNDPCWCGSGKKYKKCHLRSDEAQLADQTEQPPPDIAARLHRRLSAFVADALRPSELEEALKTYFGSKRSPLSLDDQEASPFTEWLIWDYQPKRLGRTLIEEFLARHASELTAEMRRMLQSWAGSCMSLYEVQQVRPTGELWLKDLLREQTVFVRDFRTSQQLVRWDGILARVLEGEPAKQLGASVMLVAREMIGGLRQWILEDCRSEGLPIDEYLRRKSHLVRRRLLEMLEKASGRVQLVTAEGDPLVFAKAVYRVEDRAAVLAALESCKLLARADSANDDDSQVVRFSWLETEKPVEGGRRVLGNLRLDQKLLIVECLSRARLRRGRKLIESLAGAALRHCGDEFTPWREALEKLEGERPEALPSQIPFEVQRQLKDRFYREHYHRWLDTPLPALGGRTPREAAASPAGRAELEEVLKTIENHEERKRAEGEPYFDVSRLRRELGLVE